MLDQLKFVQGSVAKKDYLPALTHFRIENGAVRGYNGTLALSSPIPFDIVCNPKAIPLVQAIRNCTETIQLSMTKAGRLSIKSGKFKAFVDCIEGETPHVEPEGEVFDLNGAAMLEAFKVLEPFVADDASRRWSNGILFQGESAFATNNVVLVEFWHAAHFPRAINVPRAAIREALRVNEPPTHAQLSDTSITFLYENGRWIRTQLYEVNWPNLASILSRDSTQQVIPEGFFAALESIKPFADKLGRVIFHNESLCTSTTEGDGASFEVPGLTVEGSYNVEMLELLNGVANTVDFSTYPKPCIFMGDRLRGAIIGLRL
jgi:DNA polymerase III sliding clamp (beta) subunit (PCNA family)